MKTLSHSLHGLPALVSFLGLVCTQSALSQPAAGNLPSGYTYMQSPPPGYGATTAAPRTAARAPAYPAYPAQSTYPQQPLVWPPGTPPPGSLPPPHTSAAPKTTSTKKKSTTPSKTSTAPKRSTSTSSGTSKDREQDHRISRLEDDVGGLRRGAVGRYSASDSSSGARGSYVVKPGDSLWQIANAHRVSPGEIMSLNRMKSDNVLVGQLLLIPGRAGASSGGSSMTKVSYKPYYYEVRSGDSSSSIAKKYGISRKSLMDANPRVDFGGGLIAGSRIVIPGKSVRMENHSSSSSSFSSAGGSYTVRPGDSLKAIAIRHGTSTAALASLNGIKDANKVIVGQRLVLPGGRAVSTSRSSLAYKPPVKSLAAASDDTVPLPGVTLPNDPPLVPPTTNKAPTYPTPSSTKPATGSASVNKVADSHRGILAYRVDASDTIETIATQFSTTPERIRQMNHLQPTTKLAGGDEIMVPTLGAVSTN